MKKCCTIVLVLLFLFSNNALASEKNLDSLKNNPALEEQLRLEVYRLVSETFTFSQGDLFNKIQKRAKDFTLQGCKQALMTINIYKLERPLLPADDYVKVLGTWQKKVAPNGVEQIEVSGAGYEPGSRRRWTYTIPLVIEVSYGLHASRHSFYLAGSLIETEKSSNSYMLHSVYPRDRESIIRKHKPWTKRHPEENFCDKLSLYDNYHYEMLGWYNFRAKKKK